MKSYIYKVVIEKEEDGRFGSYCPALPGCNSWGQTEEEALANVGDASRLYLKELTDSGRPIPVDVEVIDETVVSVAV